MGKDNKNKGPELHGSVLHEFVHLEQGFSILRVPGGWIYMIKVNVTNSGEPVFNTVFVPYDEEFDERP